MFGKTAILDIVKTVLFERLGVGLTVSLLTSPPHQRVTALMGFLFGLIVLGQHAIAARFVRNNRLWKEPLANVVADGQTPAGGAPFERDFLGWGQAKPKLGRFGIVSVDIAHAQHVVFPFA
jgi:hypothetical protein